MQPSVFNLRVPLRAGNNVFLMNTLTDAQLVVSPDVAELLDRCARGELDGETALGNDEREAWDLLVENGFLVADRATDRRRLDEYFASVRSDATELSATVLTTLQCNFACGYCFQGDHGDHNTVAEKMTLETAARVAGWIERELDRLQPERFVLTFFGGEPLLNLPVMYFLAERLWSATQSRGVRMSISVITNGLLLTPDIVHRLRPYGLSGFKITLDGDRDAHNRLRPLRGGQGTFDRIVENIRSVAGLCRIAIGGNFDETSAGSYPALLDFLSRQDFADKLGTISFKPIVRDKMTPGTPASTPRAGFAATPAARSGLAAVPTLKGVLPLVPVDATGNPLGSGAAAASTRRRDGTPDVAAIEPPVQLTAEGHAPVGTPPPGGTCMSKIGAGGSTACDGCDGLDDAMSFLREETRRHGFSTADGVHNGPCHVHHANAHTIGPDGSLYACPGFTGEQSLATGHIDGRREGALERFERLHPWTDCKDCAFIPVCAGGCVVASHTQLGDMNLPTCHKRSFESALISLAHDVASAA